MKYFTKHSIKILGIFLFFILLAPSCVTQKKNEEPKGFSKFMQNLTARYNGYFNANVLFKDANVKLEAQHIDNYSKILPVYPEADVENPKSVAPDLDKAIEKIAAVATYHRSSDWVDDCYLLLGKAQFLKHEYDNAQETFEYLTEVYNPAMKGKIGKRSKKQIEEAHKQTQKEKEALLKERAKEKADLQKEKQQALKEKIKDREDAAKQRKREYNERVKQRERDNKERARLRKLGIKPPPRDTSKQNSALKVTKPGVVRSGTNGTPVYKEPEKEIVKKKDKNPKHPDRYFLKHRPCYQEGVVWLARTYTERQDYDDADLLLAQLEKNPKTFKDIRASAAVARANFYLKQNNFEKSIPALEQAIALCKQRKQKARLIFILGQVLQNSGDNKKAFATYNQALNYTLPYDMEFNARLNKALTSDDASVEKTTATLIGMSKDYKNREFNDQIYYTLGQIAIKNNQKDKAIEYFKQSLAASTGRNTIIKADAYYTLAKLQFDAEDYASSKRYFDSSLTILPKMDDRRVEADKMSLNLVDIAHNYEVVALQDSLLRIAALSDKEKKDWAKRMYKKKRTETIAKENAAAVANKANQVEPSLQLPNQVKSNFWGYNSDIVKKSKKEFEKKWGDRRLEDNWRRSSKKSGIASADAKSGTEAGGDPTLNDILDSDYSEFLKDIPKTPEQIASAKDKVDEAMFGLGAGYHDRLQNYKKSTATFEQHLSRFPTSRHEPEDYYYLYQNYTALNNTALAQKNYDALLNKFSGTPFANVLKDNKTPGKLAEKSIDKYYNTTYALFKKGSYDTVSKRIKESPAIFGASNIYSAKFALLDAFCAGHLSGKDAYIAGLKNVIAKYAGSPEEKRAKETLRILEAGPTSAQNPTDSLQKDENSEVAKFKPDNDKLHYVLVVLPKDADLEVVKVKISDFNSKYHRLDDLKISSVFLSTEPEIPMIVVRKFKDKRAALAFTDNVKRNTKEFMGDIKAEAFAATQDNYREILRQKVIDNYKIFYQKNY